MYYVSVYLEKYIQYTVFFFFTNKIIYIIIHPKGRRGRRVESIRRQEPPQAPGTPRTPRVPPTHTAETPTRPDTPEHLQQPSTSASGFGK